MIKADATFYFVDYKGDKLDGKDAEKYLTEASYTVFNYTYGRTGRDNLTAFQIDRVKRAICAQAELTFEANAGGTVEAGNISSYSADGVSITFDTTSLSGSVNRVPHAVRRYLLPTGLINRTLFE